MEKKNYYVKFAAKNKGEAHRAKIYAEIGVNTYLNFSCPKIIIFLYIYSKITLSTIVFNRIILCACNNSRETSHNSSEQRIILRQKTLKFMK